VIDYSSRDYASIFSDLVARIPLFLPEWTSQSINDFGMVLLQMFAYVGDIIGYYEDRLAGEAFIQTATQAVSIINLAAMLDYQPTLSIGASVTLQITISSAVSGPVTIPVGTEFSTLGSSTVAPVTFITTESLILAGANGATPVTAGQVPAVQGTLYTNEAFATSNGSVNQAYSLANNPVSSNSFTVYVDTGQGPTEWSYAQSLINYGPYDQVFTNFVDANGVFYIVFGDGVNGYVPPLGSPCTCTYETNVGATGNVGAATIVQPVSALFGVTAVTNPEAATGGAAAESLASIQQNAPASLRTLNRAVTATDIQTLAIQVAGVEWASSIQQTYQLVNLYIAPYGGGAPTTVLQNAVLQYVDQLVMANTTVTVLSPTYVEINVIVNVVAFSNYGNTSTENAVTAAIVNLLSLQNTGFAFRVGLGVLYTTVQSVTGVNYATVTALNRQVLCTLTTQLVHLSNYTTINVTALPQPVNAGDSLVLVNPTLGTQTIVAEATAAAGATSISVNSFTASATFPINSTVQDVTALEDAVMLDNEIPIVGTITVNVSGGIVGS
jgi:hypothetical protein